MVVTETVAADLQAKFSKAETRVKRLESTLAQAREERDELAIAMRVLVKHGYMEGAVTAVGTSGRQAEMNALQSLIADCVPLDSAWGAAPKDVTASLHEAGRTDITGDYVRTTLWRLAKRGILKSENGLYWQARAPQAENVEAPGALTPRANNESTGPDTGRGTGFPPTPPEGSIPSGSTLSRSSPWDDDLDPDIPF